MRDLLQINAGSIKKDLIEKVANVSDMVYDMTSIKTILKEIRKCVALCVLCHAEETHKQTERT